MFGTSYLPEWSHNGFGVQYVFGTTGDPWISIDKGVRY